jgi:hypothetical protein
VIIPTLLVLAIDMEDAAADLRATGLDGAAEHADELIGAAGMVREWARMIEMDA